MVDFEPSLRPIEPAPLSPLRERRRRGQGRAFDIERELEDEQRKPDDPLASPASAHDSPVAPRAADEAGGHLDVTA